MSDAEAGILFHAADFHLAINVLNLLRLAKFIPGKRAEAVPAATPQRRASEWLFLRVHDHVYAAVSASPAPMGDTASTRGGSASNRPSEKAPTAPRLPSESTTDSAPMARICAAASRW